MGIVITNLNKNNCLLIREICSFMSPEKYLWKEGE